MSKKFLLKKSSVITGGVAKLPQPSDLDYGELAVNYAKGVETLSLKNANNEIVEFKSYPQIEKIITDNEEVIAAAFNAVADATGIVKDDGQIGYQPPSTSTTISRATSVADAVQMLADKIEELQSYINTHESQWGGGELKLTTIIDKNNIVKAEIALPPTKTLQNSNIPVMTYSDKCTIIMNGVENVNNGAFTDKNISHIIFDENIQSISFQAFYHSGIESIKFVSKQAPSFIGDACSDVSDNGTIYVPEGYDSRSYATLYDAFRSKNWTIETY